MIPKNTIIKCPSCEIDLFRTTIDLEIGMKIEEGYFKEINQKPIHGDTMNCKMCLKYYTRNGEAGLQLYTEKGWLP